jgi:hypothetical protein
MPKKTPPPPFEIPSPGINPEIKPGDMPEYPEFPGKEPDIVPEKEPSKIPPPYEIPPPGEGP